jgi:hypothetical protein
MALCPDAYFLVVITIGDTSQVSNSYTKRLTKYRGLFYKSILLYSVFYIFHNTAAACL